MRPRIQNGAGADSWTTPTTRRTKLAAKSMALSVSIRRVLWLRQWQADAASIHNLYALSFEGELLFGSSLEKIISKVTAGKSPFLPQDRRGRRNQFQNIRAERSTYKEEKFCRPGRPNYQSWRFGQSNLFCGSKRQSKAGRGKYT